MRPGRLLLGRGGVCSPLRKNSRSSVRLELVDACTPSATGLIHTLIAPMARAAGAPARVSVTVPRSSPA